MADQTVRFRATFQDDGAKAGLSGIQKEAKELGSGVGSSTALSGLSSGLTKLEGVGRGVGNALSHAAGQVKGLISNFGLLGAGGGALGIADLLKSGVQQASALGLETEKLTSITGASAATASTWIAVFSKFGITGDTVVSMFGRLEKTAYTNTETVKKATAFQKLYGFSLVDSSGHVKDANTLLLGLADSYDKNTNRAQADALASALFGKSYQQMVPILKLGSAGIKEADQAAQSLGLTLTAQNAGELKQYTVSQRQLSDAMAGLKLQIGLAVIPIFNDLAKTVTSFLAHGGMQQIVGYFKQGVIVARDFGSAFVQYVVPGIKTLISVWNGLPGNLKDLLVGGFVANKTIKFAFGIDPIKIVTSGIADAVGSGIKSLAGGLFQRGATPANPVFVQGTGLGGTGGAASAGEDVAAGAGTAAGVGIAASAAAGLGMIAQPILNVLTGINLAQQQGATSAQVDNLGGLVIGGAQHVANDVLSIFGDGVKLSPATVGALGGTWDHGTADITAAVLSLIPHIDAIDSLRTSFGDIPAAAQKSHNQVYTGPVGGGPGRGGGRAFGGPVGPGFSGDVGELGREHLTIGPGGYGYVTPIAGGSGPAPEIHVHLDGGGMMTPGASRVLANEIGPALLVWFQRQGILPRIGTPQRG